MLPTHFSLALTSDYRTLKGKMKNGSIFHEIFGSYIPRINIVFIEMTQ